MILESCFSLILGVIKGLFSTLNFSAVSLPNWSIHFTSLILKGLAFFPFEIWSVLISNIIFWVVIHFAWSVIEWVYVKIPGVN